MAFNQLFEFQKACQLVLGGEAQKISAVACVDPTEGREIDRKTQSI